MTTIIYIQRYVKGKDDSGKDDRGRATKDIGKRKEKNGDNFYGV